MKKFICLLLALTLCLLPGCDSKEECSHEYLVVNSQSPSCEEAGTIAYECDRCGHSYQIEQPALGHDYSDATCTAPKTCANCGETSGKALGHDYDGATCRRCNESKGNFDIPADGYNGKAVTITFYHQFGARLQDLLDKYIAEFNLLYPNIKVEHFTYGDYDGVHGQIKNDLTVGKAPNLALGYPYQFDLYATVDAVVSLDGLINNATYGLDKDSFVSAFYQEGLRNDGLMYSLPLCRSTEALFYNKDFFDTHGLSVPTTWDEMETLCQQIKEIDPDCIPLGYDSDSNWFLTMCTQSGSDSFGPNGEPLFDNATNHAFMERLRRWYQQGYVTTEGISGSYTSSMFVESFGTRCYMSIGSIAGATYLIPDQFNEFEVGVATIPQVDSSNPKVLAYGPSICLFQNENPQEVMASWLFMRFLTTNASFQAELSMTNYYMPVIKTAASHPTYREFLNSGNGGANLPALALKHCLTQTDAYFGQPSSYLAYHSFGHIEALFHKCLLTEKDIPTLFSECVQEILNELG